MKSTSQEKIKTSFKNAALGNIQIIQSPDDTISGSGGTGSMYLDSSNNAWIALVAIAALMILCAIMGMIVICFTYGRLVQIKLSV